MKILFVVPYVPNLIRVRPFNLIRFLSDRGNRVTVATIWTGESDRASLQQLEGCCERVLAVHTPAWRSLWNSALALPTSQPLQSVYSWDRRLADEIAHLVMETNRGEGYDVVHVEHLRGARYGLDLKARLGAAGFSVPIVWDSVDSISLLFRQATIRSKSLSSRMITRLELGRTERFEGWLLGQFERVLVTSPADQQALRALATEANQKISVETLRNGVDLDYFKPDETVAREPASLVISGKMSYHANVAMAFRLVQEIMPSVWSKRPETRVYIVGKDPPKTIEKLAQNPNITVTGTVNDLRPYLRRATLAVAPIAYGVGIQNKVLEAMACGTPVLATPQAVSALEINPGEEAMVAGDPADFAQKILHLLDDQPLRSQIGWKGRRYVEANHNWRAIAGQLEENYQQVLHPDRVLETVE